MNIPKILRKIYIENKKDFEGKKKGSLRIEGIQAYEQRMLCLFANNKDKNM